MTRSSGVRATTLGPKGAVWGKTSLRLRIGHGTPVAAPSQSDTVSAGPGAESARRWAKAPAIVS